VFAIEESRSRPWRAADGIMLRPLASGQAAENLLLLPPDALGRQPGPVRSQAGSWPGAGS
jgi:hypothetical protein